MTKSSPEPNDSLLLADLERIDELCVTFEVLWQANQNQSIETFLDKVPENQQGQLLYELISIEFDYLKQQGQSIQYDDYRARFSIHADIVERAISDAVPAIEATRLDDRSRAVPAVGQKIRYVGNYEILEEIARGGMGVVYKARQSKLNRIVALKMILSGHFASKEEVVRFLREARAAGNLDHPNVVSIHEMGEFEGRHYFTMDYVDGPSLAERLREETLSPMEAAQLVRSVAETIHFAHQKNTLHRDLKPANILLNRQGIPLITDFGLAKTADDLSGDDGEPIQITMASLTTLGAIGTPSYMSPEQAAGKPKLVGPATDIWALGAILYACLTGRPPFVADNSVDTMLQVMRHEPVSPYLLNPAVPKDLETICLKCLSKEPHERYGTAQLLADDLERFIEGRPVVARPVGRASRFFRMVKRNPIISSLITLAIGLLISGTAISSYFAVQADQRATAEKDARLYAQEQEEKAETALEETQAALQRESASLAKAEHQRARAELAEIEASRERRQAIESQKQAEAERERAEVEKKRAQWQTYVARLQPMRQAWLEKEFGHLERLLKETSPQDGDPDFRGWEWYYFQDQVNQASQKIGNPDRFFGYVKYDPVHQRVLVATPDEKWELWNLKSDMLVDRVVLKGCVHNSVSFSPDGEFVAWGTTDVRLRVMHLGSHKVIHDIDAFPEERKIKITNGPQNAVEAVVWSPDGEQLAASTNLGGIKIWKTDSGNLIHELLKGGTRARATTSLDWHAESGIAAAIRDGWVRVFNADTGQTKWSKKYTAMWPSVVAWNESGTRLIHGGDSMVIYDNQGTELASLPGAGGFTRAAWLNDDEFVYGGSNQDVRVFNVVEKQDVKEFHVHQGRIESVVVPSGEVVLSGSNDGTLRRIRLLQHKRSAIKVDVHDGHEGRSGQVFGVSWSPDGKLIGTAGMGDTAARVWNAMNGELVKEFKSDEGHPTDIEWNSDGSKLVSLHQYSVRFWDPESYELLSIRNIPGAYYGNGYREIEWREKEQQLAIVSGKVSVFDDQTLELKSHLTPEHHFLWYEFSPDGKRVCAVSLKHLFVCDVESGRTLFETRKPAAMSSGYGVDWSPDGRIFAVGGGGVFLYNASDYKLIKTLSGHRSEVFCVEYDPTGQRIASVGGDGNLIIWDAATGDPLLRIPHEGEEGLEHLEWSPDGRRIAVTSKTGSLYIWGSPDMPEMPENVDFIEDEILKSLWTPEQQLAELDRQILLSPKKLDLHITRINLAEQLEKWDVALRGVDEYMRQFKGGPWRAARGLQHANWLNDKDAIARYSKICWTTIEQEEGSSTELHAALSLLLLPNQIGESNQLLDVVERIWEKVSINHSLMPYLVALYRTEKHEQLNHLLEQKWRESDDNRLRVFVVLFDAMTAHREGRQAAAIEMLKNAELILSEPFHETEEARYKLAALLLHREISKTILGMDSPKDAAAKQAKGVWAISEREE